MTIMGANVENNGYITIIDLLHSTEVPIMCNTNLQKCCNRANTIRPGPAGDWYFPNGSIVSHKNKISDAAPFFARNRGKSVLRLFIVNNNTDMSLPPQRGRFHCEVPNSNNIGQTYFINICKLFQYPNMI